MTEKILIADDNIDNRKLLFVFLKKTGYRLFEATNGKEAVEICISRRPDLVLLDIEMPVMDGFEAISRLKNDDRTKDITVIFLTAKTNTSDIIKGLELGAADYVTKPFDRGEVLARVRSQLKIRQLNQSLKEANFALLERQRQIREDLKAAAQIQKSLIPDSSPKIDNFNFAWKFIPSEEIGGDIFNIHRLDENHISAYILDVSGHGVPSAMVTVSVSQVLLPHSGTVKKTYPEKGDDYEIVSPVQVLNYLDREYPLERFEKYFTIVYLVINVATGTVYYSSAAHPPPILIRNNGTVERLEKGGSLIGMGDYVPFEGGKTEIFSGDRLYLYTDGVVEFRNENGEEFGEERLQDILVSSFSFDLEKSCQNVIDALAEHGQNLKAQDDITIVSIEKIDPGRFEGGM